MTFFRSRRVACVMLAAAVTCGGISRAFADAAPEQADLSERLIEVAGQLQNASPDAARALADAAERMLPADPRLLREAIDLRLQLGQRDPAIKLLGQLRQLAPTDQLSLIQSIDLLSSQQETADQKAAFLQRMVDNTNLAAEVRSHAAVLLASVQDQRGLDQDVANAMTAALRLNPLNPRALQWSVDRQMRTAAAPERVHAVVQSLLSNPLQPAMLSRLAEELARVGADDVAIKLYGYEFDQFKALDIPGNANDAINYAVLLHRAGRTKEAVEINTALLKGEPDNLWAHSLDILLAQQAGDASKQIESARAATIRSLMAVLRQIDPATAIPDVAAAPVLPDFKAAVAALKKAGLPGVTEKYLIYLGNLATIDLWSAGKPAPQPVIDAIHELADPKSDLDSKIVAQVDGYGALVAGRLDEAVQKFSAVADRDAASQVGLLSTRLKQGQDKSAVLADATALLKTYPTGVMSLMIRQAVAPAGQITYTSPAADGLVAEAKRLPDRWLDFADNASSNYLIHVDSPAAKVQLGDVVLVNVTLQNLGDRPLLIGPGGVINQYIPIDVSARGIQEQNFPGAGLARLTQSLVLQPRQSISAMARVDNASVDAFLATGPQYPMSLFVSGIVNPSARNGTLVPGLGGGRGQSATVVERTTVNYTQPATQNAIATALQSTDAVQRLHAVLQLSAAVVQLQTANTDQPLTDSAAALLQKSADSDASPTVRAIARQQIAMQARGDAQTKALQTMLAAPDFESKLLGSLLTINRDAAQRESLLKPLAQDADPVIKQLAAGLMALPSATTQAAQ